MKRTESAGGELAGRLEITDLPPELVRAAVAPAFLY